MKGTWDGGRDPLRALQAGDGSLFEAFVEAEVGTFLAFFARLGAGPEEAEDLTQETLLKLFRFAPGYDPRNSFPAFAMRVARNTWIDRRRRRAARVEASSIELEEGRSRPEPAGSPALDPTRPARLAEEVQRFHRALAELSEGQRIVFELAVLQEMPYAEIAATLGIPVGTVKSRVFHAVRRLRAKLEAEEEEGS